MGHGAQGSQRTVARQDSRQHVIASRADVVEEMEFLGGVKRSEVESVQQQIVDIIRQMEDAGQISTAGGEEAEELVS
ncbi:MAG: FliG C-terminal domain-containing protein [Pirellulaceae bacterium]